MSIFKMMPCLNYAVYGGYMLPRPLCRLLIVHGFCSHPVGYETMSRQEPTKWVREHVTTINGIMASC